jgi:Family of unknown function (DUF6498)
VCRLLEIALLSVPTGTDTSVTQESTRSLLAVNAATIVVAIALHWPVATLMWPYWIQSVVIGYFSRKRILSLGRFSTAGFRMNDHDVDPTPRTQRQVANFFALHYGFFHFGYLAFLWKLSADLQWWDWFGLVPLGISFAWNHQRSFRQNIEADRCGTPNIGTLMFLPYARVVPMHASILLGTALGNNSALAVLMFGTLKTGADVLMHYIEHRVLQRSDSAAPA